jgi:hypothetical protein
MAASVVIAAPSNSSDALFRAWGKGISDALAACGLVKTGDTGQIDWSSVAHPTSTSSMMGYEVWTFNDALQATAPIFIKIQYGSESNGANNPGITLDIGHASDGAGNLTGTTATQRVFGCSTNSTSTAATFISSDGGRLNLAFVANLTSGFSFYIERTRDDSGVATGDGVDIVCWGSHGGTGFGSQQYLPASGNPNPATPNTSLFCCSPNSSSTVYGKNMGLFPIFPCLGYPGNPTMGALVYLNAEIGAAGGTLIAVTMYGTSHTFVVTAFGNTSNSINGSSSSHCLAIRHE